MALKSVPLPYFWIQYRLECPWRHTCKELASLPCLHHSDPVGLHVCFLGVGLSIFLLCGSRCPRGALSLEVFHCSIRHHGQHKHRQQNVQFDVGLQFGAVTKGNDKSK